MQWRRPALQSMISRSMIDDLIGTMGKRHHPFIVHQIIYSAELES
jgi:hypothetical protein